MLNRHQAFYGLRMRGADWAPVGDGGRPEEVGTTQEQGMLRQPATRCYSYIRRRLICMAQRELASPRLPHMHYPRTKHDEEPGGVQFYTIHFEL